MIGNYVYAFDLSMDTVGITVFDTRGNYQLITSIRTNPKKTHGYRLAQIQECIEQIIKLYPPNKIIIERGFSRFNVATQVVYRVHGIINLMFFKYEQVYYPPLKVKEAILSGKATKKQLADEIMLRYPELNFNNDDESDSFAVGLTYFIKNNIIEWTKKDVKKSGRKR